MRRLLHHYYIWQLLLHEYEILRIYAECYALGTTQLGDAAELKGRLSLVVACVLGSALCTAACSAFTETARSFSPIVLVACGR